MLRRVLIVEDSPTVRAEVVSALGNDFVCLEAKDGVEGLDAAVRQRPDAIISDIEMPVMGGLALLDALKKDARTHMIPVVMITTSEGSKYINDCRKLGCAGFLLKPVDGRYLSEKLKQLIR